MSRRRRRLLLYPVVLPPTEEALIDKNGAILKDANGKILTTG